MPCIDPWPTWVRHTPRSPDPAGGVGPGVAGDHRAAGALAPDLQLADRGGAEGIAGGQHDRLAIGENHNRLGHHLARDVLAGGYLLSRVGGGMVLNLERHLVLA